MLVLQKEVRSIMGNTIHTPKTIYSNGLVLEFYVKNKEIGVASLSAHTINSSSCKLSAHEVLS